MNQLFWLGRGYGPDGWVAGSEVLKSIAKSDPSIACVVLAKGNVAKTMWESDTAIYLGRGSKMNYMEASQVHWSAVGKKSHEEIKAKAAAKGKKFFYLFVTEDIKNKRANYWLVPSEKLDFLFQEKPKADGYHHVWIHMGANKLSGTYTLGNAGCNPKLSVGVEWKVVDLDHDYQMYGTIIHGLTKLVDESTTRYHDAFIEHAVEEATVKANNDLGRGFGLDTVSPLAAAVQYAKSEMESWTAALAYAVNKFGPKLVDKADEIVK